ncbi:Phosphoenolpyruvate carboxykinase (ATP) [Halanaeroarchaeum sp. HSR-CO]|uniref:phosphoenolpyruvate carboxykinase (ATP) n=1 Tax=Halanaeroarchaeum sp. HSR-CO TaxID=2866382 RepID=UPI00217EB6F0|nr:phosphoenolpyruvate carboxykinase (ATP) [Halanaeroarchaeum sp. HSR-CO]UWG48395.1 Phosphoenolpyruvate carboxykinase (ATP) [Halanaeroarchaeum sp. HSR-CO]
MSNSGTALENGLSEAVRQPNDADHVTVNPSFEDLRAFSRDLERTTSFGAPSYVSEYRSRSAEKTKNAIDDEFERADYDLVEEALDIVDAGDEEFVCVDRTVGRHPEESYHARLFVPKAYGRIALGWAKLLEPAEGDDPDFVTIQIPDDDRTAIRVLPDQGLTVVLGSDYTGEAKKSFLRLFMRRAKEAGGLGLHAGSKRVRLERDGDLETVGQVFLGLSGTGKSTLTGHGFWLDDPETAEMLQDDVCALRTDGVVAGSEGKGLYIKTIGLTREQQPELYDAATRESAILENVSVAADGSVDFDRDEHTTNSRAVVQRETMSSASEDIDLESIDQVFFITRNPLMPPIAKLSDEQAAAAFMLGESVQTSAGDPDSAGESIRVVGTNPFIIGSKGAEGNRFHDLIADLDVDTFVINTGTIGGDAVDIGVEDTVRLLTETARGTVEWREDDDIGMTVPDEVPGMDVSRFDVPSVVDDFAEEHAALREERREYLAQFEDLRETIVDAAY